MIIVLFVLALFVLSIIFRLMSVSEETFQGCFLAALIGIGVISAVVFTSYITYLHDRSFYDSGFYIEKAAIEEYIDRTSIGTKGELTDLKYEGRMKYLYSLINGLRHDVEKYNRDIIEKRKMDNNILLSWIIIAPDEDMKLLDFGGNKYIDSLCEKK